MTRKRIVFCLLCGNQDYYKFEVLDMDEYNQWNATNSAIRGQMKDSDCKCSKCGEVSDTANSRLSQ